MKKRDILWLAMLLLFAACGGDDSPNPGPTPDPDPEPPSPYAECLPNVTDTTLEIVTWNIQNFPMSLTNTPAAVKEIIEDLDVDVIALQEIKSVEDFVLLVNSLDGWEGHVEQLVDKAQSLAYLYKTSEITVLEAPSNLFAVFDQENNDAFTSVRRPLHMKIRHSNGLEVDLINVHLKCCGGSEDRRRLSSQKLKEYMDTNYEDERAILLGDFNDDIADPVDNVFQNFIDDPEDYRFTTLSIALGPDNGWSYPSWPSHLDQILITAELLENEMSTQVLKLGTCVSTYDNIVSDHRPVMIGLAAF